MNRPEETGFFGIEGWLLFLQESMLARHYPQTAMIMGNSLAGNPVLDKILPNALLIRLVSLLDDALEFYIAHEGLSMPRRFKRDLDGKIEFLRSETLILNPESLHGLRQRRNEIAHDPNAAGVSWLELDSAVDKSEVELQHLELVGRRPNYEFFGERSRAQDSNDPKILFSIEYCAGIKEADDWVYRIDWVKNVHRSLSS